MWVLSDSQCLINVPKQWNFQGWAMSGWASDPCSHSSCQLPRTEPQQLVVKRSGFGSICCLPCIWDYSSSSKHHFLGEFYRCLEQFWIYLNVMRHADFMKISEVWRFVEDILRNSSCIHGAFSVLRDVCSAGSKQCDVPSKSRYLERMPPLNQTRCAHMSTWNQQRMGCSSHWNRDWAVEQNPGLEPSWANTPMAGNSTPLYYNARNIGVLKPSFSILRAHHVRRCRNVIVVLSCHAQQLMSRAIPGCRVALQSGCAKSLAARHPKIPQAGRDKNMV